MLCYKDAIEWLGRNDDNEWIKEEDSSLSVSASLVADIYNKADEQIRNDLIKELKRLETAGSQSWRKFPRKIYKRREKPWKGARMTDIANAIRNFNK